MCDVVPSPADGAHRGSALAKPQKAKALLRGVVEAILMQPTPEGYAVRVTLKKTDPAILSDGGAGDYETGCGGRI